MTPERFTKEVDAALERVTELQLRGQMASPDDAPALLVEALEELTTVFARLEAVREELRAANEALAACELKASAERDRYKDLFEFAPNGYLVTDPAGVVVQANEAARQLLHVGPRGAAHKPLAAFVHPDDRAAYLAQLTGLQRGEPAWASTLRLQPQRDGKRDGKRDGGRAVAVSVVPFRDPDTLAPMLRWQLRDAGGAAAAGGDLVRLLAAAADGFAAAPDAVWEQLRRWVVPHIGDWCFVQLADPPQTVPLVLAEAAHEEVVRALPAATCRPQRVLVVHDTASPPADLSPAEDDPVELFAALGWKAALWLPLTAGGETFGGLAVGLSRPGPWADGAAAAATAVAQLAAATFRAADLAARLAEADRRRDDFVTVLAHELRNPLTPIRTAVQILALKTPAQDSSAARALSVLDRQVVKMDRLINDLMEAGRLAQGKVQLHPEVFDLGPAAAAAAEAVRERAAGRGLRLAVTVPPDPVWVEADAARLDQVIGNLLDNALKYTESGGAVTVAVEAGVDGRAAVRVADTGVGIPADVLPQVFDLFTQADRSLTRAQGGLGVGLAVVRQLVQLHGGSVEARSDGPGKGSEFVVRLPKAAPATRSEPAAAAAPSLSVVVIDDDRGDAAVLAGLLEAAGLRVWVAPDADAGIGRVRASPSDLVVVAPELADVSGREVAKELRDGPRGRRPAVVCFGEPGDGPPWCEDLLPRPATPAAVAELLKRLWVL